VRADRFVVLELMSPAMSLFTAHFATFGLSNDRTLISSQAHFKRDICYRAATSLVSQRCPFKNDDYGCDCDDDY